MSANLQPYMSIIEPTAFPRKPYNLSNGQVAIGKVRNVSKPHKMDKVKDDHVSAIKPCHIPSGHVACVPVDEPREITKGDKLHYF